MPIPTINEQQRIVSRIEELFSELDKGVETLQTIKQQLETYRQAVLKEAMSVYECPIAKLAMFVVISLIARIQRLNGLRVDTYA